VGPVLRRLLRDLRIEERRRGSGVAAAWEEAAGRDVASAARPVALRGGVLTVEVEGAALLQELRGFRAPALLEALRRAPGGEGVRSIRWVPAGRS
jgi:predicted nucleic acid-binding Zn ribbon protein